MRGHGVERIFFVLNLTTKKNICVIGLGYIGLPTASLLANRGYSIAGVDTNSHVVDTINCGKIHIFEPGLDTFVRAAVESGNLKAFMSPQKSDIYIICVPTPFIENAASTPQPDLSYVIAAATSIRPLIKPGDMVILESTSPVGTTEMISKIFADFGIDISKISIAYCPERVLPGKVMLELVQNDRIIGGLNEHSTRCVQAFYETFVQGELILTDAKMAEMTKLVENSYRDVNIAFANELSMICKGLDIDVWRLIEVANHHPRVDILRPGSGVGGHCIAVDPWFIVSGNPTGSRLIRTAREVNDSKPEWIVDSILNAVNHFSHDQDRKPIVGIFGLAFKQDIDDLRNSPAIAICHKLQHHRIDMLVCEPNVEIYEDFQIKPLDEVLASSDILVFLVAHSPFKKISVTAGVTVLDYCGLGIK